MKVWLNGKVCEPEQAQISVLDHGLLYGDGVFEGLRASNGKIVDLDLHLERLQNSARGIWLELPAREALRQLVIETFRAHGEPNAYARLVVTRGVGKLGLDPSGCQPTCLCIVDTIQMFSSDSRSRGLDLATVSQRRPDPDVLDPSVKSLNYLNNVLAKLDAKRQGADEALMLNSRGLVAEASAANVFLLTAGRLLTPPCSDGALPGLTRRRILQVAEQLGLQAETTQLSRYDLLAAEQVFLSGTGAGLVPVRSLDGLPIPCPQGEQSVVARLAPVLATYASNNGAAFLEAPLSVD